MSEGTSGSGYGQDKSDLSKNDPNKKLSLFKEKSKLLNRSDANLSETASNSSHAELKKEIYSSKGNLSLPSSTASNPDLLASVKGGTDAGKEQKGSKGKFTKWKEKAIGTGERIKVIAAEKKQEFTVELEGLREKHRKKGTIK
jgi:leucyl-tRNA synthetase